MGITVALPLTIILKLPDSKESKNKAKSNALLFMSVNPTLSPEGSRAESTLQIYHFYYLQTKYFVIFCSKIFKPNFNQINAKKFSFDGKHVWKIGINFSSEKRTVDGWN